MGDVKPSKDSWDAFAVKKSSKNTGKPIPSKLSNFTSKVSSEASCDVNEANSSAGEAVEEEKTAEAASDNTRTRQHWLQSQI